MATAKLSELTALSSLASAAVPAQEALERALPILKNGLNADEVWLVYGDQQGFRSFGSSELELSEIALWLVNHDLTSRQGPCGFDLRDRRVEDFRAASARGGYNHVAALVPRASGTGEMLVARGSWSRGFGASRLRMLEAAMPAIAILMERRLDLLRAERLRHQLSAIASITNVMSNSGDMESVLTGIAGTISSATGIDYVSIDLLDDEGKVSLRCVNSTRPEVQQLTDRWKRGAARADPVRDIVVQTRRPMLFPDAQNDERILEPARNYFVRTLIRSTALFPLVAKDHVFGTLSFASYLPRTFAGPEVELMDGLAGQVSAAINGIRLYQELAESRKELQRLNEELQSSMGIEHHLARTDSLSGIPNRRFIDESIEAEVQRVRRYGGRLSVVMADVDGLKEVNDIYSHQAGDETLRFVAEVARASCREVDVVGRYGGDEFLFVLPSTPVGHAAALAERFRERLANSPAAHRTGHPLRLTVSLGAAEWEPQEMNEPSALIARADGAMYDAKAEGGNRTVVAKAMGSRAA